jgi:hypothetical protein
MTNQLKIIVLAIFMTACSTEGVFVAAKQDSGAIEVIEPASGPIRRTVGPDFDGGTPDTFVQKDTLGVDIFVQKDTFVAIDTFVQKDTLVQSDTFLKIDTIISKDTLVTSTYTKYEDYPNHTIPAEKNVCLNKDLHSTIEYITKPIPDLSDGRCVDLLWLRYDATEFIVLDCQVFKDNGGCLDSFYSKCGFCKITCEKC